MDSKTGLDSKILLWLAGEIGLQVTDSNSECVICRETAGHEVFSMEHIRLLSLRGSWLREKAHEMLLANKMYLLKTENGICFYHQRHVCISGHFASLREAIPPAVEWLYNKEHDND